jgi:hypothetical protein
MTTASYTNNNRGSSIPTLLILFGFALIAIFFLSKVLIERPRSTVLPANNLHRLSVADWQLQDPFSGLGGLDSRDNLERALAGLLVLSTTQSEWQALDPGSFGLTFPKDICNQVQQLTGFPCEWEINKITNKDGSTVVEIVLKSGEYILARGQAGRIVAKEMVEILPSQVAGHSHAWIASLEVASWLRGLKLGTFIWQTLDKVIGQYSHKIYGQPALRIFADASSGEGWGAKLMSTVPQAWEIANKTWIYVIP